ncbi:MAG: hypothetical protein HDS07_09250 [Bacteroides sp.]|nr:hypothetical protein [Bacteroides sp.]
MKFRLILFAVLSIFFINGNAQNIVTLSETPDQITCQVTVTGVKEKKATEAAESALRYALFFRGLPDSKYCKTPLTGTDERVTSQHPQYFKEMFEKGRFSTFITNIYFENYTKKNKISVICFTVNLKALRLDLETQGVKRRFGI